MTIPGLSVGIRLGWQEITGAPSRWADVTRRLRRYSLAEVLDYLTRLSAVLFNITDRDVEAQARLCQAFFGVNAQAIWDGRRAFIARATLEDGRAPQTVRLFDETAVSLAVKFALMNVPGDAPHTGADLRHLGEALLMLNDKVGEAEQDLATASADSSEGLAYLSYVLGIFRDRGNWLHTVSRAYDLFLTDRPSLRNRTPYFDLPSLVRTATGLEADELWAILFAFHSHFATIRAENAHQAAGVIDVDSYFTRHFAFSEEEVQRFFALVSRSAAVLAQECSTLYSVQSPKAYHVLPFAQSPVIAIGPRAFCPMVELVFDKLVYGIYHSLLNSVAPADRTILTRYLGSVFQDYVDQCLRRAMPPAAGQERATYVGPEALEQVAAVTGAKSCDGVLAYADGVVLLEVKARFYPVDAQSGLNRDKFLDRLRNNVVAAASQMDATITQIRMDRLNGVGVPFCGGLPFCPVMVSLSRLPMQPPLLLWIREQVRQAGFLLAHDVLPMEVIQIDELEGLTQFIHSGRSLAGLLVRKARDTEWRDGSLNNYALFTGVPTYGERDPYLAEVFGRITGRALDMMRQRRRPDAPAEA